MNKASEGDGILAELFLTLKDDAVKVLHSICQQIWKTQQWPQHCKKSVFILIPRQRMFKLPQNCIHFTCQQGNAQNPSSQTSTIHELRTSRCTSWIQKRQRNQRSKCQHLLDHRKNSKKSKLKRKKSTSASLTTPKTFDCVDHNKLENSSRDGNTRSPYLPPEKPVCQPRSNS